MFLRTVLVTALVVGLAGGPAAADNNPNGMIFRAVGWFRGKGQISDGAITCEIPNATTKIFDGTFGMGLWNTFGTPTLFFPDPNNGFGDPCGGYLELRNNLLDQSIAVDRIEMRLSIPGAARFRRLGIRTFRAFPIACMPFRRATAYVGAVLPPSNAGDGASGDIPNVAFIQMLPLVTTDVVQCLREQYGPMPASVFASLPLVIKATAVGVSDAGSTYRSNPIAYTLNLRHTCGNGRVDDGEQCDATAPGNTCYGACTGGTCTNNSNLGCTSNADCVGTCQAPGGTSECTCLF